MPFSPPALRSVIALSSALLSLGAVGCSSQLSASELPSGAHVQELAGIRSVVHGTVTPGTTESPSCDPVTASTSGHLVQLGDDALMTIALRPTTEGEPLRGATLHVTHLDSKRTWCVPVDETGLTAEVGGDLSRGVYAVSVSEGPKGHAMPYEIVFRKL